MPRPALRFEPLEDRTAPSVTLLDRATAGGTGSTPGGMSGLVAFPTSSTISVSADGQRVAYLTTAADVSAEPDPTPNGAGTTTAQVYIFDRPTGTTTLVSVDPTGGYRGNGRSSDPVLSADGRFVAFTSSSSNLLAVGNGGAGQMAVFVRDLTTGTTELVSWNRAGTASGNGTSEALAISPDGRYVYFRSVATDLTSNPVAGAVANLFARDRQTGTTVLVSVTAAGAGATQPVYYHQNGTNGRYVVFSTATPGVVPNRTSQLFIRDLQNQVTYGIAPDSVAVDRAAATSPDGRFWLYRASTGQSRLLDISTNLTRNLTGPVVDPVFSADGRYVVYSANEAVVRLESATGATTTVSAGGYGSPLAPALGISADGRDVTFRSSTDDLVAGDTNHDYDLFVRDMDSQAVTLLSRSPDGTPTGATIGAAQVAAGGGAVVFISRSDALVPDDRNGTYDVFAASTGGGAVELVSRRGADPVTAPGGAEFFSVSRNGRFALFSSDLGEPALDRAGLPRNRGLYLHDRDTGDTQLLDRTGGRSLYSLTASPRVAGMRPVVSDDGRYVAFTLPGYGFVNNGNSGTDVFLLDTQTGDLTLVSRNRDGTQSGNAPSTDPLLSADGRYVFFASEATDLTAAPTTPYRGALYRFDRTTGETVPAFVTPDGSAAWMYPSSGSPYLVSPDGRYVAAESRVALVPEDRNADPDLYLRDLLTGDTRLVTAGPTGSAVGFPGGSTRVLGLSDDARRVLFSSTTRGFLDPPVGDTNGVYVRDTETGITTGLGSGSQGAISPDGRRVAVNDGVELRVRDLATGATFLANVNLAGTVSVNDGVLLPTYDTDYPFAFSSDGRFVLFATAAPNLVPGDGGDGIDLFIRDLDAGRTTILTSSTAAPAYPDIPAVLTSDGRRVYFTSFRTDLVPGDVNRAPDVFAASYDPVNALVGVVYADAARNGVQNPEDPPLAGRTVFLDANGNGSLDPTERAAVTDATGTYRFFDLPAGAYTVVIVPAPGDAVVSPAGGAATVTVADPTTVVAGPAFGLTTDLPDLTVTAVSAPAAALAGRSIEVSWEVVNAGPGAAGGSWQDAVYLSADDVLDASDRLLRVESHAGGLAPGGRYRAAARVTLDGPFDGSFHVLVAADRRHQVGEGGPWEGNNTRAVPLTVTVPVLTPGSPAADAFDAPTGTHYYRFDVAPDQAYQVRFDAAAGDGTNVLSADPVPDDANPARAAYLSRPGTADALVRVARGSGGTLYLAVDHRGGAAHPYAYTITAVPHGLTVDDFSPRAGAGRFTVKVFGTDFAPGTTVELTRAGGPTRPAAAVTIADPTRLDVTFDTTGLPAGYYALVVRDGTRSATAADGLTVTPFATPGRVTARLVGPAAIARGREEGLYLEYGNSGGQDLPVPVFVIQAENGTLRYPVEDAAPADRVFVLGVNPDGPAGVLPPGVFNRVVVGMRTVQTSMLSHYTVSQVDPAAPFDWGYFIGAFAGTNPPPAELAGVVDRARAAFGSTWGEVAGAVVAGWSNRPGGSAAETDFARLVGQAVFAAEVTRPQPGGLSGNPGGQAASLLPGSVRGTVYLERTDDGAFDPVLNDGNNDWGIRNRTVYLDLNGNGRPDAGEPTSVTGYSGGYEFVGLLAGDYQLRVADEDGYRPTPPVPVQVEPDESVQVDIPVRFDVVDSRPAVNPSEHVGPYFVDLIRVGPTTPGARTFVLAHGWNGIDGNNRIIPLAQKIREVYGAGVNVYVVDWSGGSITDGGGIPVFGGVNPFGAAQGITPTAGALADMLLARRIDPEAITAIGESFGTYVMNEVADRMFAATGRKTARLVAFNPASQLGTHFILRFSTAFRFSYAFHAERTPYAPVVGGEQYNLGDHHGSLADIDLELAVDPNVRPGDEGWYWGHIYGFVWMIGALQYSKGDKGHGWLDKNSSDFVSCPLGLYDGIATLPNIPDPAHGWLYLPLCVPPTRLPVDFFDLQGTSELIRLGFASIISVGSHDPNEKIGPAGAGAGGFLPADGVVPYTIRFENEAGTATAPAQEVFVTDALAPDLDWDAVELGAFGFAGRTFDLPPGLRAYRGRIDATSPDGSPLLVDVEIALDPVAGVLSWAFRSVDPATGALPADPFAGFLPVNDDTGRGEGFVRFTARPRAGLPTGTRLDNTAAIVFDLNPPVVTNATRNTLDAVAPASAVEPLPAAVAAAGIALRWNGTDDAGGSGVASYTVYVSDDGGPFVPYLVNTTATAATFTGSDGHAYRFLCVATDEAGNVQPITAVAQAATLVDRSRPTSRVNPLPPTAGGSFTVSWSGDDGPAGSGVAGYTLLVSTDGGPAVPFLTGTTATSVLFPGRPGHSYTFWTVAVDAAGNREAAPAAADAAATVAVVDAGGVRPLAVSGAADGSVRLLAPNGGSSSTSPFGNTGTTTRTAWGDVDGDGVADIVAVTGPGTPIRVTVRSGTDGRVLVAPFDPFGGDFLGGGFVAAGDLDGDGRAEFVVTPDQGGGPRVTVFTRNPDGSTAVRSNFLGIDDANFRGGARAAVGDVNGDGVPDVVVAAGFGGGPRTAIFTGQSVLAGSPVRLVPDFFAFPGADATNLRNGAFVAAGDVDGDGFADLIFGGGPGGAPRVFILSGALVSAGQVGAAQANPVANFFVAGDLADRGGARVAVTNADGDGRADVAVGSGAGRPARVRLYMGKDFAAGGEPAASDLDALGGALLADGVYVG
ncbi:MAG: SdrD B-like domain-containing protein [Gemmataceae bacterium]